MGKRLDRTVSGGAFHRLEQHWLAAPLERSALFFPTFSAISLEIQRTLRERIPTAYFGSTEQFATTRTAYPVLIYHASRPYRAKAKTDFTYDVLNQSMMASFFRIVKPNLGAVLSAIVERLRSEGREELIRPYQPHRVLEVIAAVQKRSASTSLLYDLLVGESALVNELLRMGGFGNKSRREQSRISTTLFKSWDFHLRRMCPGHDFRPLGPELFEIATHALLAQQKAAREPRRSPMRCEEDDEGLLYESDGTESLSGLGLIEVRDRNLLAAVDESHAVGRIHELEGLPE
jgi:hypothetical protein